MLSQIVEALLFSNSHPLTLEQISRILEVKGTKQIRIVIEELNHFYEESQRAFRIHSVAGGYQLRTEPRFKKWVRKGDVNKTARLSTSVLETLSIVAYKQPVTRSTVEEIRAVDSSYTLRTLLEKNLIKIAGREDSPGRPLLYKTTSTFLELFGFKNLSDLPTLMEFDLTEESVSPE